MPPFLFHTGKKDKGAETRPLIFMTSPASPNPVILGLDPRIHYFNGLWMVGSSPTMTKREVSDHDKADKKGAENRPLPF